MQDHRRQAAGVLAQQREGVVLGGAGVDGHRQPEPAGQVELGLEGAALVVSRGVVAVVVEAGLADRAGVRVRPPRARSPRGRRRPKPAASFGWRPTIANTSHVLAPRPSARPIEAPSIPTVASRVTPGQRGRARPARRRAARSGRGGSGCRPWAAADRPAPRIRPLRARATRPAGRAARGPRSRAPPAGRPRRAPSSDRSSWPERASSRSAEPGMNGCRSTETTRRPSASAVEHLVELLRLGLVLGSFHGSSSWTNALRRLTRCQISSSAAVSSTRSMRSATASSRPSKSATSRDGGSASGTTPSR